MIKKSNLTLAEVKEKLAKVGMRIKKDSDTNEFLVYPQGSKPGEEDTYFTHQTTKDDLQDALITGLDMAGRIKKSKPNPSKKCKIIRVRRKVSLGKGKAKIIRVRRKVCNPKEEGGYYKRMTYGKLPTKKEFSKAFDEQLPGIYFRVTNDKLYDTHNFTESELWKELNRIVEDSHFMPNEKQMEWASSVLDVLGFEWI